MTKNDYWRKYWKEGGKAMEAAEVLVEYCESRDTNCKDCVFHIKEDCVLNLGENPNNWVLEEDEEENET